MQTAAARRAACWDLEPSSVLGFRLDIGEAPSLTQATPVLPRRLPTAARLKLDFVVRPASITSALVRGKNNALVERYILPEWSV
jgi:hypothetical protein